MLYGRCVRGFWRQILVYTLLWVGKFECFYSFISFLMDLGCPLLRGSSDRRLRRCAATLPPSSGKDIHRLNFLFCLRGGDGGGEGLGGRKYILLGSSLQWNVSSSVLVYDVSQLLKALIFIGGVDIEDGTDGSCDSGL